LGKVYKVVEYLTVKTKECPSCAMEVDAKSKICPICGYEFAGHTPVIKWLAIILIVAFLIILLANL
jgi:RNA polymerase subunit RPABC4/transcription elongation factor Spt4